MDLPRTRIVHRKGGKENPERVNRRPVKVRVTRINTYKTPTTDINNNQNRIVVHPENPTGPPAKSIIGFCYGDLPPVSLCFSLIQILLYVIRDMIGVTTEEAVYVSWSTVITKGEIWRLFGAQYFHFAKVLLFFDVLQLMVIGRCLEKKIKKSALVIMILLMTTLSNSLYIFLSNLICSGASIQFIYGFWSGMTALRIIHVFTLDRDANNGKGDPNMILGFLPVYLPACISPWQPVMETFFFDYFVFDRCIAATISGALAGLTFPLLVKYCRNFIMIPLNLPPAPPKVRPRYATSHSVIDPNDESESTSESNVDSNGDNGNSGSSDNLSVLSGNNNIHNHNNGP